MIRCPKCGSICVLNGDCDCCSGEEKIEEYEEEED